MEQGIEDDETNEEIEITISLGPLIRNQGHNGVPSRDQVVKDHAIQYIFILQKREKEQNTQNKKRINQIIIIVVVVIVIIIIIIIIIIIKANQSANVTTANQL